jgi:hypothetical protein
LFDEFCIFLRPRVVMVEVIRNDGLPAFIDMDVFDGLLARPVQLRQCLQRCAAIALGLQRRGGGSMGMNP